MIEYVIAAVAVPIIAFGTVYATTPALTRYLIRTNSVVPDYFKKEKTMVTRPGGPVIIAGILASEAILYALAPSVAVLTIMIASALAFVVGFIDDKKVMGGWFKPLALAAIAIPVVLLGAYDTDLAFPLFGSVKIPILYLGVIAIIMAVTGNTINSIDILNGVASGFMIIAGSTITICLVIVQNYEVAIASLPLVFVALAFYKYHKFPSRIFPGDSGALVFGVMYGTIAIVGDIEVIAAVALLPAAVNSFLFLSSVKRIVEHRQIKKKPVYVTDDCKIKATKDPDAPITLLRIITSKIPMSERQAAFVIFRLAVFAGVLAVITALLMDVRL